MNINKFKYNKKNHKIFFSSLTALLWLAYYPPILQAQAIAQPQVYSKVHPLLTVRGYQFRDSNGNGTLEPFEDWRLSPEQRSLDLTSRMSLKEKVGMMMIDTFRFSSGGGIEDKEKGLITKENMTRFIFRNPVVEQPVPNTQQLSPREIAEAMNQVQELAERTAHGIPILFKSNARNHLDPQAREGINVTSGAFSTWPKEAGLAATRDMALIGEFASIMAQEWRSVGIRGMYGYMLDLSTEPRWYRVHETFTENAELMSEIAKQLILGLQGEKLNNQSIALTMKHFPGGGPQENGGDPHYDYGKNQSYEGHYFDYHLKPFITAINLGVSAIMPYYGIPVGQDIQPNNVGMAFSKGIVTELLRDKLQFKGYVNSDTGIIGDRAWGLEELTEAEQIAIAVNAGTDILSGYHTNKILLDVVTQGNMTEERVDVSVRRLLQEQFTLGLFENAYVDPEMAVATLGKKEYQDKADLAQRKSIVLLKNYGIDKPLLPLKATSDRGQKTPVYIMGVDKDVVEGYGFRAIVGDHFENTPLPKIPTEVNKAIIRIVVSTPYEEERRFGGAAPDELNLLSFSDMAKAKTWTISPTLADITTVMQRVGRQNTILSIHYRQPFVLDEVSHLSEAGAIFATFGVSDSALLDVITGKFNPVGKLPFALPNKPSSVVTQLSDMPGYHPLDLWRPYGFGMSYQ